MAVVPLVTSRKDPAGTAVPVFALGFRPFFLVAGAAAVVLLALWVLHYTAQTALGAYYPPAIWHGHEMVFGYTVAVIAGFLLTAVRNWTDLQTLRGAPLAVLVALWVAGRVLPFHADEVPHAVVAGTDLLFLPLLTVALAVPLLRRREARNLVFLPLLLALTLANALVHCEILGYAQSTARIGLYLGVNLVVLIIAVIGGRVIPFFTQRALPGAAPRQWPAVEGVGYGSIVAFAVLDGLWPAGLSGGLVALLAAVSHGVRLAGWYDRRIWGVPLLWVLHAGYAWMVIGFGLAAVAAAGLISPGAALHAFTVGAIGMLTLGMMARVALGHTGRPLEPARVMGLAFVLVVAAAGVRVAGATLAAAEWYIWSVSLSGALWGGAFAVFVAVYTPILLRPRVDGQPG